MALPIEGDRWLVLFGGVHGETAPADPDERLAYARSLPSPVIADLLASCDPLDEPTTHRFPSSQRRHVERLKRFPLGWVLLGDAVGSFNPIYGQGMTVAALQATALGEALDRSGRIDRAFGRRYFKAASRIVNRAWSTAVGSDFAYDQTTGPKPLGTDLINRYMDRVITAAQHDDAIVLRFNEVVAMVRRPETLVTPAFALRILGSWWRTRKRDPVEVRTPDRRANGVINPESAVDIDHIDGIAKRIVDVNGAQHGRHGYPQATVAKRPHVPKPPGDDVERPG